MKYKSWFLAFSGTLVLLSIIAIGYFGLKEGIDFTGGTLWQIALPNARVTPGDVSKFLKDSAKLDDITIITQPGTHNILLRLKTITEAEHQDILGQLTKQYPSIKELSFESVGPTIGNEIRTRAIWSFILVLLGISLYIAFAFRTVSFPVSSWKYGLITLITLFHDAIIPAGIFTLLGYFLNAEIDTNFVVAILVVMGFSVHDTIVVFDRIRENLRLTRDRKFSFNDLVGKSINETMARSINTSLTLVIVLVALYIFGAPSLGYFILTILVGTVVGTYSSICVASPLLTLWRKNDNNR